MQRSFWLGCAAALALAGSAIAAPVLAPPAAPGPAVQPYVKLAAGWVVLEHVNLIDGAGAPAKPDQTIVLHDGKIASIGRDTSFPPEVKPVVLDLTGRTLIPG